MHPVPFLRLVLTLIFSPFVRRPRSLFLVPLCLAFLLFCVEHVDASSEAEGFYIEELVSKANQQHLAETRYWHLLLHYRKNWLGGFQSDADGPAFFLSSEGKTDPNLELEETLRSFFSAIKETPEKQHPQCQFPARYAWLKQQLSFDSTRLAQQICPRFNQWKASLNPESVTVIFADAYMDSPPSMYGHTFLRLDKKAGGKQHLLDYAINFAANTNTQNGVVFALKGLFGGYDGIFSTTPYYIKVQTYTNIESRDLWEYRLNLDSAQTLRLVEHLWELGSTSFDYFFLTENCSYQLLPLLDVADPSLHLSEKLKPWVIPIDTIRAVLSPPGFVTAITRRPSQVNNMLARRSFLSLEEQHLMEEISRYDDSSNYEKLFVLPKERQTLILDAAYDFFRYREGFHRDQSKTKKKIERKILIQRAKLPNRPAQIDPLEGAVPPHSAHGTGRIGLSLGLRRGAAFEELSLRPSLHDFGSDFTGYVPFSHLEMFHLKLRFDNVAKKVFIEKLSLMEVISLPPSDPWNTKMSWKIKTGLDQAKALDCLFGECLYYQLNGGRGWSQTLPFLQGGISYLFGELDLGIGDIFRENYRAGFGASAGLLMNMTPRWRVHIEGGVFRFPLGDIRTNTSLLVKQVFSLSKKFEMRLTLEKESRYREMLFTLNTFF